MNPKIRGAFSAFKRTFQRITSGSRQFLSGELDRIKKFSKVLAREIVALFIMAIVAGIALSSLIKSFVFDLLMPFFGLVSPKGDWRNLHIRVGETRFNVGNFLAHLILFLLVALLVHLLLKLMPKRPSLTLRKLLRTCPTCGEILPADATQCDNCGATFLDLSEKKQPEK